MNEELKQGKKMFRVEKFIPTECPKCKSPFREEARDYIRLFGDIVEGQKVVRETTGHDIIICKKCENITARVMIEACQVFDRNKAVALLREGFVNLQLVQAFGNHAEDAHEVFTSMPGLRVRSLKNL